MTTALRDQLQKIYDIEGQLTARLLVATAKPKTHPLHDRFEWNNQIAGQKYRESQAAELIRSVEIVYGEDENGTQKKVRAFHSVNRVDGPSYVPADEIRHDDFMSALMLQTAEREWKALYSKYAHLREFLQIVRDQVA